MQQVVQLGGSEPPSSGDDDDRRVMVVNVSFVIETEVLAGELRDVQIQTPTTHCHLVVVTVIISIESREKKVAVVLHRLIEGLNHLIDVIDPLSRLVPSTSTRSS